MRVAPGAERVTPGGGAAQARIPGAYAWLVTVAPVAWAHGRGPESVWLIAAAALGVLLAGPYSESRFGSRGRHASLWGFVMACSAVWLLSPGGLAALRFDEPSAAAAMLGWALYGLASAAPPLKPGADWGVPGQPGDLVPRRRIAGGDAMYVGLAAAVAASLQVIGWEVTNPERALLIRFSTLVCGLGILGTSTEIALERHSSNMPRSPGVRFRSAALSLTLLLALALGGVLVAGRD